MRDFVNSLLFMLCGTCSKLFDMPNPIITQISYLIKLIWTMIAMKTDIAGFFWTDTKIVSHLRESFLNPPIACTCEESVEY